MRTSVFDERKGRGVPKSRRPTISENHFVAGRKSIQGGEPLTNPTNKLANGLLAVGGTEQMRVAYQVLDLFWPNLRRATPEATVERN
jgi:hypothetical protein